MAPPDGHINCPLLESKTPKPYAEVVFGGTPDQVARFVVKDDHVAPLAGAVIVG